MQDLWQRIIENLFGRLDGPLHFRFVIQPLMACIFAIIDGLKDAREGKPAYFWALITDPGHRSELLKSGWQHVGKIFFLGVALDIAYQMKVFQRIYAGELLIVAVSLAIVPYILLRGPVNLVMFNKKARKDNRV